MRVLRLALGVACLVLGTQSAVAQQCPNQPVGPLQGTSAEYCLTPTEVSNVDFAQSVFVTTTIGPVVTVSFNQTGTVAYARWTNPTYQPRACAASANHPDPLNPAPGDSSGGFTAGQASGCVALVLQENCLNLSQAGQAVITARSTACPLPPVPGCTGGPPAQSKTASCPCPLAMIPECSEVIVPITASVSGTLNSIDCTDSANWTDLNGAAQSKTCFTVRQRCTCATISGPFICDTANMTVHQPQPNCQYAMTVPNVPIIPPGPPFLRDDIEGDGFDPPSDGV